MIEITEDQKADIAKAIRLKRDGVYDDNDLQAHMEQIVKDNNLVHDKHKEQLERMLFKTEELIQAQFRFFSGHKSELSRCKKLEKELWEKIQNLLKKGYNIDRFKQQPPQQGALI